MKKTIMGTLIALGLVASFSGCDKKVEAEVNATETNTSVETNVSEVNTAEAPVEAEVNATEAK